jgi:hypothetical protein
MELSEEEIKALEKSLGLNDLKRGFEGLTKRTGDLAKIIEQVSSPRPEIFKCPHGDCGYTTDDLGKYIKHIAGGMIQGAYKDLSDKIHHFDPECPECRESFEEALKDVRRREKKAKESKGIKLYK